MQIPPQLHLTLSQEVERRQTQQGSCMIVNARDFMLLRIVARAESRRQGPGHGHCFALGVVTMVLVWTQEVGKKFSPPSFRRYYASCQYTYMRSRMM